MNKRERFEAFLNNRPVDRVPSGIFHHYMPTAEWMAGTKERRSFEKLIAGQLVTKRKTDPDICKIMNDVLMIMPIDVSMVKEPGDLKNVVPPAMDSVYVSRTLELTERVLQFYVDEDIPSFVTSFAPIFSLRHCLEDELHKDIMGELFAADPQAAYDGMRTVAERTMEIHRKLFDAFPLDGIYFSVNNQNSVLTDELYREIAAPIEKEMIADINKRGITFMHICGTRGQTNNLKLYTDYDFAATVSITLDRLMYPEELGEEARARYETFAAQNARQLLELLIRDRETERIRFLTEKVPPLLSREALESGAQYASAAGQTQICALIMDAIMKDSAGQGSDLLLMPEAW